MTFLKFKSAAHNYFQTDWPLVVVMALFIVLAISYSIINPIHEGTDELRHYRFMRYLVVNGTLPVQGQEACRSQSHHPPLFYVLGAVATGWIETGQDVCRTPPENPFWGYRYWEVSTDNKNLYLHGKSEAFPWRGEILAARIGRFLNVLIGAIAIIFTYLTARLLWQKDSRLAAGATAFIALNPMFLYMSGTLNNDVIAAASGAAVIYACTRLLFSKSGLSLKWGVAFGVIYGIALMSKFNLAPVILLMLATTTWVAWRRKQWRLWLSIFLVMLAISALIAGWWFMRNYSLYGEPTGFETVTELWGVRTPAESVGLVIQELPQAWSTLWGRFGYGQIPLPNGYYLAIKWVMWIALVGLLTRIFLTLKGKPPFEHDPRPMFPSLLLLGLTAVGFFGVLIAYMLVSPAGAMGRFFFPGLPALSILIFMGLSSWYMILQRLRQRQSTNQISLVIFTSGGMLAVALIALIGYLAPAYANPSFWKNIEADIPMTAQFDSLAVLHGHSLSQETLYPGDTVELTLYWEVINKPPGEYWLFAHLMDDIGSMVTQRDTHPGLGKFPTTEWQAGDRFVDTVSLTIPDTIYPSETDLSIGLYAPGSYRLPIMDKTGQSLGDSITVGKITLKSAEGPLPNSQNLNFSNIVRLVGYDYSIRVVEAGEKIEITLYWEMLKGDLDGMVSKIDMANSDRSEKEYSENSLQKRRPPPGEGRIIEDVHTIHIDAEDAADFYSVTLNLFDFFTESKVNILAEDGHWIDNELELPKIRIEAATNQ